MLSGRSGNARQWFPFPLLLSSLHACEEAAVYLATVEISRERQKCSYTRLPSLL